MTAARETEIDSKTEKTEMIVGTTRKKEIMEIERTKIGQKTGELIVGKIQILLMRGTVTTRLGPVTEVPKEEAKILTEARGNKTGAETPRQGLAEKYTGMREEEDFRVTKVSPQRLEKHRATEILA